jgi:murein DD-endopeptidase MepM/ murein hydrolase activator NlpD
VTVPPGLPVESTITDRGAPARVTSRPPVKIDAPVRGAGWVAAGSCCDGPHRRALQPVNGHLVMGQRFAIDFNRADAAGRWVVGDPDVNTSWVFYDDPVLAVADGTVVAAEDRWADQIPNHPREVRLPEADGNHVIIRFGRDRYAGYAHLVPGSVRVRVGQRVRAGQVIGRLGNSGSSSGPHLHFQVMTRPSLVDANGLAFTFRRFTLQGRIPPLTDELGAQVNAGEAIPMDTSGAGPRRNELPLGRDVVAFP